MRKLLGLLALFACSSLANAQLPKANVFLGYAYQNADLNGNGSDRSNLNGWEGTLEAKLLPFIGLVLDFSGHYGGADINATTLCPIPVCSGTLHVHESEHNFLFGPRLSVSVGHVRPFAHALFGGAHVRLNGNGFSSTDTAFALALGGGFDYRLAGPIQWRFQGDYLQTQFFSGTQHNARFSTGIVLAF